MPPLSTLDLAAITAFVLAWLGLSRAVIEWSPWARDGLNRVMERYRHAWMREMLARENRIIDTQIMGSLQNGTAFFASTSLFAIGGALALLRAGGEWQKVIADLPFDLEVPGTGMWEVKVLGLTLMFVYAFFKFSWAYRLFNYAAIMMGAVPTGPHKKRPRCAGKPFIASASLHALAGRHFNRGQRALFFALGYSGMVRQWLGADRNHGCGDGDHVQSPVRPRHPQAVRWRPNRDQVKSDIAAKMTNEMAKPLAHATICQPAPESSGFSINLLTNKCMVRPIFDWPLSPPAGGRRGNGTTPMPKCSGPRRQ